MEIMPEDIGDIELKLINYTMICRHRKIQIIKQDGVT